MRTHETRIGEGDANVTCHYHFDSDGCLDDLEVMFQGVNITDALTDQQLADIESECLDSALSDYEERKHDTAIDNHIERMTT